MFCIQGKKGFTLIELLAVILILGIIALIAIPTVNKIIKESRRESFETTVNNVVAAIEDACQLEELKGQAITTIYKFNNSSVSPILNIKGSLPKNGTVTLNSNCRTTVSLNNGSISAIKKLSEDKVTILDGIVYPDGMIMYYNPVSGSACTFDDYTANTSSSNTGNKAGCMKWYIINDTGESSSTIDMILDHNTTAVVAYNLSGNNSSMNQVMTALASDTSTWQSSLNARLITANDIANITDNTSFNGATATYDNWYYLDSNNKTKSPNAKGKSNYAWLFDHTKNCISSGCEVADENTYGYWTSTPVHGVTQTAWQVDVFGALNNNHVENAVTYGVRPVITVSKSIIS